MRTQSSPPAAGDERVDPGAELKEFPRPSDNRPVFVVGSPRSGTSLLYHMLISSEAFPVYMSESKIMPCSTYYGPLDEENRARFLRDFLGSRQFVRSGLSASVFAARAERAPRTYVGFLRLFMDDIARAQGKTRWVEKTPAHLGFLEDLAQEFSSAKFVHIIRDGRDVALSIRRLGWTHAYGDNKLFQLLDAAKRWQVSVVEGRRQGKRLGDQYLEITYEDLVTDPEGTVERVAGFAEIEPTMKSPESEFADSLESANTAFSSPMQGISDEAVGRWRRKLTERDLGALDHAIGDTLNEFNYELSGVGAGPGLAGRLFTRGYPHLERLRVLLKRRTLLGRMSDSPLELGLG